MAASYLPETVGGTYVINEADLDSVTVYGKPGRPPKPKVEAEKSASKKRIRRKDLTRLLKGLSS